MDNLELVSFQIISAVGVAKSSYIEAMKIAEKGDFDLAKANALLNEAGYLDSNHDGIREKNGQKIVLNYYESADHGSSDANIIAQSLQSEAKKLVLK